MLDFKKHQKKFMAFFGVFLMIAFALPSAVSNIQNRREETIGYAGSDKVTNKDVAQAKQELEDLRYVTTLRRGDPRDPSAMPQAVPVVDAALGVTKSRELQNNPELYVLLVREAERMGITVPQDQVREILANRAQGAGGTNLSDADLAPAVENLLKVVTAARRATAGLQATLPQVQDELSKHQAISLNVVEFRAQDYLSKVPPYSDAERAKKLAEQYERFKNVLPTTRPANEKTGEPQNEFAFGYRVPNQVQVQYIEVPRDAVVRLVKGKITEVDAIKYYMENKDAKYPTTKPVEPITFRASPPPPDSVAAKTPAGQPATRAAVPKVFTETVAITQMAPPPLAFKDYKDRVYADLTNERATQLSNDILNEINSTLAADYAEFKKSPAGQAITATSTTLPTTGPATAPRASSTSPSVPYNSFEYLQKLALHVQEKYQLLPTVGFTTGLQSEQQLQASPLGQATLPEYFSILSAVMQQTSDLTQARAVGEIARFPRFATNLIEPLVTPTVNQLAKAFRLRALALYEPSPMMESGSFASQPPSGGLFVFRAIQAVPAHAAPKSEVTEQLLADARLRDAYELARKDAERLAAEAKKTGRLASATEAAGKKVIATGMLDLRMPPDFGALKIEDRATQQVFINTAYDLLKAGHEGPDRQHPIGVIDLKPVTAVFAGQVNEIKPIWQPNTLTAFERIVKVEQDQAAVASNQSLWFSADDIIRRMQYRELNPSKRSSTPTSPPENQPPEQNPFVP